MLRKDRLHFNLLVGQPRGDFREPLLLPEGPTMRRIQYRRFLVTVAMSLALLVGFAGSRTAAAADCRPSSFSRKPLFASTAFWNGSNLVVLDAGRRDLLLYDGHDGRTRGEVSGMLSKSLGDLDPISAARRTDGVTGDGRIIVLGEYNRFQILDPTYTFVRGVDVFSLPTTEGSTIERIYTWAPTWSPKRKDVVAFADLKKGDQWSTGIVRFPVDGRPNASTLFLKELPVNAASRKFHRLGYLLIGSHQEDGFVLLMENGFRLFKSDRAGELTELERFHETFPAKEVPALPSFVSPNDYASIMSEIEEAAAPTAIHSWEGDLWLVWRRPHEKGGTEWLLSKLRPDNGEIIATVVIPSRSNHLLAAPGRESWSFLEKGPAFGLRDQEARSVVTVSSQTVRDKIAEAKNEKRVKHLCP